MAIIDIKAVKKELESLPLGSIVKRTTNGVVRYSHQWRKGGKTHSYCLRPEDVPSLSEKIERRKILQHILKENAAAACVETEYFSQVTTGEELKAWMRQASGLEKRDAFPSLMRFLSGASESRVFILYGLRRTGKTTMLQQAVAMLPVDEFDRAAYVQVTGSDTMADVNADLEKLRGAGYRYVFIDEITMMEDFIDGAALLADIHAPLGLKIVLSGTDSLGFWLSLGDTLYDRAYVMHTTYIPFREYARLLRREDVDDYIRYGGMLRPGAPLRDENGVETEDTSFRSEAALRRYVDTAIARNIQHALATYADGTRFLELRPLFESGELTGAVNRVIEDVNHRFLLSVLERDFKSHDLGVAARNLRNERDASHRVELRDVVSFAAVTEALKSALKILDRAERTVQVTTGQVAELKRYLCALDLIVDVPLRHLTDDGRIVEDELTLISQPGMRWCQTEALVDAMMRDKAFAAVSEADRRYITERIKDEVRGRMLEEIVLLENVRRGRAAYKLQFDAGEIDMVIADEDSGRLELFEIKHSSEREDGQFRHLVDGRKLALVRSRLGEIASRTVLYRGENIDLPNGVRYRNVNEHLIASR